MVSLPTMIAASLLGSALCVMLTLWLARVMRDAGLTAIVGFAVGTLLGVVFLQMLPQVLNASGYASGAVIALLLGILGFFLLEKLFVWRHHHGGQWVSEHDAHEVNDHAPSAALMRLGNATHSVFDGFFIATTFLISVRLGTLSAIALFAHEFAQQLGDARSAQLRLANDSQASAAFNRAVLQRGVLAAIATIAGVLLGYFFLSTSSGAAANIAIGFAAAGMMYVAMADLIPSLHQHTDSAVGLQQIVLIAAGVGTVALLGAFF